jgi:hypothetical protein
MAPSDEKAKAIEHQALASEVSRMARECLEAEGVPGFMILAEMLVHGFGAIGMPERQVRARFGATIKAAAARALIEVPAKGRG